MLKKWTGLDRKDQELMQYSRNVGVEKKLLAGKNGGGIITVYTWNLFPLSAKKFWLLQWPSSFKAKGMWKKDPPAEASDLLWTQLGKEIPKTWMQEFKGLLMSSISDVPELMVGMLPWYFRHIWSGDESV